MAFSIETIGRVWAAGRNLGNQAIGIAVGAGLATAAQQQGFVEALDQIWKGAQMIYSGGSSLYAIGIVVLGPPLGWFWTYVAQRSAKTDNQAAAIHAAVLDPNTTLSKDAKVSIVSAAADPTLGTTGIVNPELAAEPATPGNVVSTKAAIPAAA